jgi:hypothetical protein
VRGNDTVFEAGVRVPGAACREPSYGKDESPKAATPAGIGLTVNEHASQRPVLENGLEAQIQTRLVRHAPSVSRNVILGGWPVNADRHSSLRGPNKSLLDGMPCSMHFAE